MKIRNAIGILLACSIVSLASTAFAGSIKIAFWYPGEAGSTEEAQPILDEFCKYLDGKVAPDTVRGKYFNTVEGGLAYISKERPQVGIVSYAAWTQQKAKLGNATVLAATLPLPGGTATESYALVGPVDKLPEGAQVFTSEPLDASFVRSQLFPDLSAGVKLSQTPQVIMKLKDIGDGKLQAFAILTPTEAATLAQVSAAWAQGVKTIFRSRPVPTARVVLFDPAWKDAERFKAALIGLRNDPKAADILDELRLKGFAEK